MRLEELQRAVQAHVLAGGDLPAALEQAVQPPAAERWEIYTEGYRLRLVEALTAQYPALAARLGATAFDERMRAFVAATPSLHRSVRDYGSEVGAFLTAQAASEEDALLGELALFEWQLAAAFDASDAVAAAPADLARVAPGEWPSLRFAALPSVRRLRLSGEAVAAWRAASASAADADGPGDGGKSPGPAVASAAVPVAGGAPATVRGAPVEWLIWRPLLTTQFRSCEPDEAAVFDMLVGGACFGELCERLLASHGDHAALQAAGWLKGWLTEGLLLRR